MPAHGPEGAPTWPPIEGHAVIGDGRALALVDRTGTITWMALPEDDRMVLFSSLLDPDRGGSWALNPVEPHDVEQTYEPDTAVLRTTFRTSEGVVEVTDCFDLHNGAVLPWVELTRRVRLVEGSMELRWELSTPGHLGARLAAWYADGDLLRCRVGAMGMALLVWGDVRTERTGTVASGSLALDADRVEAIFTLVVSIDSPVVRPDRTEIEARVARTVQTWRTWSRGIEIDGPYAEPVRRSAITLKLLLQQATGAPLAAATTSLPERVGGDRNFDYRYCWVRDASFTVDALLGIGLVEEAHSAIGALLGMAESTRPDLAPLYTVAGGEPGREEEIDLVGYRRSRPVRRGNSAAAQLQLGVWGDLMDAMWRYVQHGNHLDPNTRELLAELTDQLCRRWQETDAGIWELHEQQHYTSSKLLAWTALDRALRLSSLGQLAGDTERWAREAGSLRRFVLEHCWSAARGCFTMAAGSDELDAACLLAGRTGFADRAQLEGTVEAVRRELADGPFVWRSTSLRSEEGAFLACSFWLVDALARLDRGDEAVEVLEGAMAAANEVGLLSEEHDPATRTALGNVPQGLSHLALVNAVTVVEDRQGRRPLALEDRLGQG